MKLLYLRAHTWESAPARSRLRSLSASFAGEIGGFTLIELMVSIALLAILLGIAVPSLRQFIVRNSFESTVLELRGAVSRTRAEAIARGSVVSFAPPTAGNWTTGYEVFVDPLQRGAFTAGDTVGGGSGTDVRSAERLQVGTIPTGASLSWPTTASTAAPSAPYFMFDSRGRPIAPTGFGGNASLPVCVPSAIMATNNCREIVVDPVGRVRVNPYTKTI